MRRVTLAARIPAVAHSNGCCSRPQHLWSWIQRLIDTVVPALGVTSCDDSGLVVLQFARQPRRQVRHERNGQRRAGDDERRDRYMDDGLRLSARRRRQRRLVRRAEASVRRTVADVPRAARHVRL